MTVFGHAVLFDCRENGEDTASPKTPKQWHIDRALGGDKVVGCVDWDGRETRPRLNVGASSR